MNPTLEYHSLSKFQLCNTVLSTTVIPVYIRSPDWEFPLWLSGQRIQLGTMRVWVWSLASLSGLWIRHCCELWCRSQMWLGSGVAVALSGRGQQQHLRLDPWPGNFYMLRVQPLKKDERQKIIIIIDPQTLIIIKIVPFYQPLISPIL